MTMEIEFSEKNFKQYYFNQFSNDLLTFLKEYRENAPANTDLYFIDQGVRHYLWAVTTNYNIKISDTTEHICYFDVCLTYCHLYVYLMYKIDPELAYSFCRCTGYPMINCGLGGIMHPYQILLEMKLLPPKKSAESLLKCIIDAAPFMKTEMVPFLEGKQEVPNKADYKKVVDQMNGKVDTFWNSVLEALTKEDFWNKYYCYRSPDNVL